MRVSVFHLVHIQSFTCTKFYDHGFNHELYTYIYIYIYLFYRHVHICFNILLSSLLTLPSLPLFTRHFHQDLSAAADFPKQMEDFGKVLVQVS